MPNKHKVTIPIGPQHPALKEPESFLITLKGEKITDFKARLGYNPWQDQRRTGKLQSDAQHPTIARHPGSVVFIIYPGQNKYAAAHQYGTRYMPPRQPLPCPTESDCTKEAEKLGELLLKARGWL